LPLIRAALKAGLPLLAICRGLQELNVALGGSLHPRVHELPGKLDHRENGALPRHQRYEPAHPVRLAEGGVLADLVGSVEVMVNSLHAQGIDRLADGLRVEATAVDGLVEAVSVEGVPTFAVAVQWHAEWHFRDNTLAQALFHRLGAAARARQRTRTRQLHDREV
jgi:putative glutamine amidotransferase